MKPAGNFPVSPLLRKLLKKRNELAIEVILRELKGWIANVSVRKPEAKNHTGLNQLRKLIRVKVKHGLELLRLEEPKRFTIIHSLSPRSSKVVDKELAFG